MKKTYLYAGISILCWSTVATVSKLLLNTLSSFQVLMFSALFAALMLLAVNAFTGRLRLLLTYRLKDYVLILLIHLRVPFSITFFSMRERRAWMPLRLLSSTIYGLSCAWFLPALF